jgi:hypothetical protein
MDVSVLGLAGSMLSPTLREALGPARYWGLAAAVFGLGPSLMRLAAARLSPSAAVDGQQPLSKGQRRLARLDLLVLLALVLAQSLCCLAALCEGFLAPWPFPVACTAVTSAVLALRLARPAAFMRRRLLLMTTARAICTCFALFNASMWTLGARPAKAYGNPGTMAAVGALAATLIKMVCIRGHALAHVVLQVGLACAGRCSSCACAGPALRCMLLHVAEAQLQAAAAVLAQQPPAVKARAFPSHRSTCSTRR